MKLPEDSKMVASSIRTPSPYADSAIAKLLTKQIAIVQNTGKSQRDIAMAIGYKKPTMVSMMKRGDAMVPLDKVPALARAIDVDLALLFRLALQQYWKDEARVIAQIFGDVITRDERKLLQMFHAANKGVELEPDSAL